VTRQAADLVVLEAKVKTMDRRGRTGDAVAVKDGRVAAIGTTPDLRRLVDAKTVVVQGRGRTVVPGFIYAHTHWGLTAQTLALAIDCGTPPVQTIADIIAQGRAALARTPPGQWLLLQGSTFQDHYLREGRFPTRADLDRVSTEHPVLYRASLHELIVNSRALQVSGITRDTPDPPGARIGRDPETGEPTGVLAEMYGSLPLPKPTPDDLTRSLRRVALEHMLRNGVTSAQEIWDSPEVLRAQARLVGAREAPIRLTAYGWVPLAGSLETLLTRRVEDVEIERDWVELSGVKLFADGGTSSYTAAFHEAYPGRPGHLGSLNYTDEELEELVGTAHRAGAQILVHACGDRAQDQVLRTFEKVAPDSPRERPHRIEHCGNTLWDDERAAWCRRVGVSPVPNCEFIYNYGEFWQGALGPSRARRCVPLRSMLDAGFEVAGTADTTGGALITLNPLHNMWRAVTRRTFRNRIIDPDERISIDEALTMYTRSAAIAGGYGGSRGTLEVGKLGDLLVLSADLDGIGPDDLRAVRVTHTVVDGRVVFSEDGEG